MQSNSCKSRSNDGRAPEPRRRRLCLLGITCFALLATLQGCVYARTITSIEPQSDGSYIMTGVKTIPFALLENPRGFVWRGTYDATTRTMTFEDLESDAQYAELP